MIGIINLGNSNLMSLTNSLDYLSISYKVINNPDDLSLIDNIILPGVGSFKSGVDKLQELYLFEKILFEVKVNKKPILGICLGMQLLFESSEEDPGSIGLGLLKGKTVNLPKSKNFKIPRIGWADSQVNFDFLSLAKNSEMDFYYIHSFYVKPNDQNVVSISTDENITAAIHSDNIYGCQFHPEKSHINGLNILKAFSKIKRVNV
jgi:glutamine amidotransferase